MDCDIDFDGANLLRTSQPDKVGADRARLALFDAEFGDIGALEAASQLYTVCRQMCLKPYACFVVVCDDTVQYASLVGWWWW